MSIILETGMDTRPENLNPGFSTRPIWAPRWPDFEPGTRNFSKLNPDPARTQNFVFLLKKNFKGSYFTVKSILILQRAKQKKLKLKNFWWLKNLRRKQFRGSNYFVQFLCKILNLRWNCFYLSNGPEAQIYLNYK